MLFANIEMFIAINKFISDLFIAINKFYKFKSGENAWLRIDMVGKGPPQHLDFTSIIAYLTEKL